MPFAQAPSTTTHENCRFQIFGVFGSADGSLLIAEIRVKINRGLIKLSKMAVMTSALVFWQQFAPLLLSLLEFCRHILWNVAAGTCQINLHEARKSRPCAMLTVCLRQWINREQDIPLGPVEDGSLQAQRIGMRESSGEVRLLIAISSPAIIVALYNPHITRNNPHIYSQNSPCISPITLGVLIPSSSRLVGASQACPYADPPQRDNCEAPAVTTDLRDLDSGLVRLKAFSYGPWRSPA